MAEIRSDELQVGDRLLCTVEEARETADGVAIAVRVPGVQNPVRTVLIRERLVDVRG